MLYNFVLYLKNVSESCPSVVSESCEFHSLQSLPEKAAVTAIGPIMATPVIINAAVPIFLKKPILSPLYWTKAVSCRRRSSIGQYQFNWVVQLNDIKVILTLRFSYFA